ncbi:hypothetical protein ACFWBB_30360 [Streptomyces sp. NPDC060000]|uniref:LexA family protein n=1 Tax=Streptomyces sp. NPDC060000 TaxID=3347031 RepID=UPI0036ADD9AD
MDGTDFPDDLLQTQRAWNATYRALAAPRPRNVSALRRRLLRLSAPAVRASVVAPVLDAGAGRPGGAAPPGPRSGAAAVNRRPQHLTAREEEILRAIRHSVQDRGEALSVRELARELGLRSPAPVAYHLEERGALVRDGRSWQSCRLTG